MTSKLWLATFWSYKHISWHLADLFTGLSQHTLHTFEPKIRGNYPGGKKDGGIYIAIPFKNISQLLSSFQLDQDLRQINILQVKSSIPPISLHVGLLDWNCTLVFLFNFSSWKNPLYKCLLQFTLSTDNVGSQVLGPPKLNKQQLTKFGK